MRQDTVRIGTGGAGDAVDGIIEQWRRERPDLDPSGKAITGRIIRLASLFQQVNSDAFGPLGLNDGDYGVLATLRRTGDPYELTPSELARQRMMTSGGMTVALDRLERKGMLTRSPNPADRRGSLVRLTPAGLALINQAMERHAETEQRLIEALSDAERKKLADLLRKLLLAIDH